MRRIVPLAAVFSLSLAIAPAQKTNTENQVRDRGQTRTADESQSFDRGHLGRQPAIASKPVTVRGMLVDASCVDRSAANLFQTPQSPNSPPAQPASTNRGGVSSHGVSVNGSTAQSERADVMAHQVADMRARAYDPTCAVTGSTRGLAFLTGDGRLLNLDEGGNTLALDRLDSSAAGRAMLNGTGPSLKPKLTAEGTIHGDRLIVSRIVRLE